MTSEETKQRYIDEFNSTDLIIKEPLENSVRFSMSFVQKAHFEINGISNKKFKVSFINGKNQLVYQTEMSSGMWSSPSKTYFEKWKILKSLIIRSEKIWYSELLMRNRKNLRP